MKPVIVTSTLYAGLDETRARLALQTISEARKHDYDIVIVDESSPQIREAFTEAGATKVSPAETPGMGPARRQAIKEATLLTDESGIIIWIEPEKHTFVPLLQEVIEELLSESADLAVPRRKSLVSYPESQRHFEWLNNRAFQMFTGRDLDHCVGVRVFRKSFARFFLEYQGNYGDKWEMHLVAIIRGLKAGKKVIEVPVDYVHPATQTADEEGKWPVFKKRMDQLLNTIAVVEGEYS